MCELCVIAEVQNYCQALIEKKSEPMKTEIEHSSCPPPALEVLEKSSFIYNFLPISHLLPKNKMHDQNHIRNVAIIAHIDHGKTTLLDGLLKQSNIFRDNQDVPERAMDSYDQEKERGITIFSKPTSIYHNDTKINLVDTPGHADFSSEVERVLGMVNSVLLIVDAKEGPMPQTRFVLSKALSMGLCPIVVLNKIDRPNADPDRVLNETFDLFVELGANDEQLDFKHCYASALQGFCQRELTDPQENLIPLLDLIVEAVPAPVGDADKPFQLQATSLSYDDFRGRQVGGRILQGSVKKGTRVRCLGKDGRDDSYTITMVEGYSGLQRVEMEEAGTGDIVVLSGITEVDIGDTICAPEITEALPPINIDAPTIAVDLTVNNGPFVGRSGKHVTYNKIKERLLREQRNNVSYIIDEKDSQTITVAGRGELHLSILMEALRREGYEFCVSKPQAVTQMIDGVKQEPISQVYIEVPDEYSGTVIEQLANRKGEMRSLHIDDQDITHLEFFIPVRGLSGYRSEFLTSTRGLGILTSTFDHYAPMKGAITGRRTGVLCSMNNGKANAYASFTIEQRGELFTEPGDEVYEGMIVGANSRDNDLVVNIIKPKQLTNVRASGTDDNIVLKPPRRFNIEEAIGYIDDDELLEVTPDAVRMRKRLLTEVERTRASRKK